MSFVQVRAHWNDLIFMTHIVHVNNSTCIAGSGFSADFSPQIFTFQLFFDGIYSLQNLKISHTMASPSNPHSFNHSFAWFCFKNTNSVHFMHEKKSLIFNSFWNNAWDLIYFHDDFVGAENSFPTHFPFPLFRNFYELNIRI